MSASLTASYLRISRSRLHTPGASWIAFGAVVLACAVGFVLADRPLVGVGMLVALVYVPLAVVRLPLAIALWSPLVFLEGVPALNSASKVAGLLLTAAWLASLFAGSRADAVAVLRRNRALLWTLGALLTWLTLSVLWADSPGDVLSDAWHWWAVALLFLIVSSSLPTVRSVQWVMIGMLAGALASVLIGLASGELTRAVVATDVDRLNSGAGDPNVLAAGLVAATILAFSLMVPLRKPMWRWALLVSVIVLLFGLVATQSRGGSLAAVVAALATIVVYRRQRVAVGGALLVATGALIVLFAMFPATWHRVTSYSDEGNGRTELWTLAWRMTEAHPALGIGLNNFSVDAPRYVVDPGELKYVQIVIAILPVVHNIYLQLLAENGVIGLLLFLAIAGRCMYAAWSAGRRFDAHGDPIGTALSRAVLVGGISVLAAGFFLSAAVDLRLWLFFALGIAVSELSTAPARRRRQDGAPIRPQLMWTRGGARLARTR